MSELTEKERYLITDLQDQEKLCIEKYEKNEKNAKDPILKELFKWIKKEEQKHYNSLEKLLNGKVVSTSTSKENEVYKPKATYTKNYNQEDKDNDAFLCTDAISVEKYVAGAYCFDLFQFANPKIRKLLNDIESEEQTHAEKIYIYKSVNQMV